MDKMVSLCVGSKPVGRRIYLCKLSIGSVQYIYVIQNTPIESVFSMAQQLADHVVLVGYQQLADLARQRELSSR